jgi:HEAT repeats
MVAVPVWQTHAALRSCDQGQVSLAQGVDRLGGPEAATRRLSYYVQLPDCVASRRSTAVRMLGNCGSDAIPVLLELGRTRDGRAEVARALMDIGAPAVDPLIATLSGSETHAQEMAMFALAGIGDSRAVPPLISILKGNDEPARKSAAFALSIMEERRAVPPLIDLLRGDSPKWYVPPVLAGIGDPRAVRPLIEALDNKDASLRRAAAQALGHLGAVGAIARLESAEQHDESVGVRQAAAEALLKIRRRIDQLKSTRKSHQ